MITKQISVFLENVSGRLADVTALLAENNINLRAMSIADTTDFGILRMVADKPEAAVDALKAAGFTARVTEVIGVAVKDHPGALARIAALFHEAKIGIEYLYASLDGQEMAVIILKVTDLAKGLELLEKSGFSTAPKF